MCQSTGRTGETSIGGEGRDLRGGGVQGLEGIEFGINLAEFRGGVRVCEGSLAIPVGSGHGTGLDIAGFVPIT